VTDDTTAFAEAPMHAAADCLHQLGNTCISRLGDMLDMARRWEAASSGATKDRAHMAVKAIEEQINDIAAFMMAYGTQVSNSASEMMALDRRLADTINVG
jgi:oligoribonuclease (3'-5' exoribonuclease)